ncbi:MAG: hypothetical protein HY296_03000 [Thaumarchaeota archaeon]|nr:hypothetical protein [Nitrososphaerota archaeon]
MKTSGWFAVMAVIGLTVLTGAYSYYSQSVPSDSFGCSSPQGYLTIVSDASGYNDSINQPLPWPVITVQRGSVVNLFVCNNDGSSAHGFAIDHYLVSGAAIAPGRNFRVSFVADQAGNFTIYCNIFCPVHKFMVGRLVVSP